MKKFFIIIGIIILIIIIIVYFSLGTDFSSSTSLNLTYQGNILVKSQKPIYTSNYTNKILYLTESGLREYNTDTNTSKILNPETSVKGLAYDAQSGKYLILGINGKLYNLSNDGTLISYGNQQTLYSKLHDTKAGGYYLESTDKLFFYTGSVSPKNTGTYGKIILKS